MTALGSEVIGAGFEPEEQTTTSDLTATTSDFDLPALRFLVSLIALSLPPLVFLITLTITSSISASYYTNARDPFVGFLFVIGALFWAYDGHPEPKVSEKDESAKRNIVLKIEQALYKVPESLVSKIGGTAAILAAICPTACDLCKTDTRSTIHYIAAAILFSAIVYFCLIAFPYQTKVKIKDEEIRKAKLERDGSKEALEEIHTLNEMQEKQTRRMKFYLRVGLIIAVVMLTLVTAQFTVAESTRIALHLTYWAEFVALWLFGFAWLIATRTVPYFAQEKERYHPFRRNVQKLNK
jgi:hypothetical protein